MKKMAMAALGLGLVLSGCGKLGTVGAELAANRMNIGVYVGDSASVERAKVDKEGKVTIEESQPVTFRFSSRPGSDAVTITGYRILSDVIDGVERVETPVSNDKMNLYVPSGYECANRRSGESCKGNEEDMYITNGQSVEHQTFFAAGLGVMAANKGANVNRTLTIEFYGFSSNGAAFTKTVSGVTSRGLYIPQ